MANYKTIFKYPIIGLEVGVDENNKSHLLKLFGKVFGGSDGDDSGGDDKSTVSTATFLQVQANKANNLEIVCSNLYQEDLKDIWDNKYCGIQGYGVNYGQIDANALFIFGDMSFDYTTKRYRVYVFNNGVESAKNLYIYYNGFDDVYGYAVADTAPSSSDYIYPEPRPTM